MWICDGIAASLAQRMGGIWLCPIECEGVALEGVSPALLPRQAVRFADSIASFIGSDGSPHTALWPSPSMASAKARFKHPCSRAISGSSNDHPYPLWPICRLRLRRRP